MLLYFKIFNICVLQIAWGWNVYCIKCVFAYYYLDYMVALIFMFEHVKERSGGAGWNLKKQSDEKLACMK